MTNTTVFEAMGMVRDSLIRESLTFFEAQAPTSRAQQPNAFSRFINSGWGVAVICAFVGLGVLTGMIFVLRTPLRRGSCYLQEEGYVV